MTEVVGLGYRRAFEFLIKDYAIGKENDEPKKENIKKMQLSQVVNTYFPDGEVKDLLVRPAWIGNDFSHYESRHLNIKLEDLRQLVLISVSKIDESIKTRKFIERIDRK